MNRGENGPVVTRRFHTHSTHSGVAKVSEEAAVMGDIEDTVPASKDGWDFSSSDEDKENVAPASVHYW